MPVDTSFYSMAKPIEAPSYLDSQQKAMALSQLGMQNQALARQAQAQDKAIADQQAVRQAMAAHTHGGKLDQEGFLSALGTVAPDARMAWEDHLNKSKKDAAEAQGAGADAIQKTYNITGPAFENMAKMPEEQRAVVYPKIIQQLKDQGVNVSSMDHPYDPDAFRQYYGNWLNNKEHLANQLTRSNIDKNVAETDKTRSETIKRNPGLLGQVDDPARLIPLMVPKEHQAKAFAEVDAAENTRNMGKSIMDSFDQAANDNTILRTGAGLLRTPPSVLALHQSMQPTFKDMEGTVRQAAMDNTFRNITPAPGDSDATIATKRQALQSYLQSKASAPTARGYGIDLAAYGRTAPYTKPDPRKKSDSGGAVKSAQAAEPPKHGDVQEGYVFMGGDPADQANWKRSR